MTWRTERAQVCCECDAIVPLGKELAAPNPFDRDERIEGCPECREINTLVLACPWDGCTRVVSMGMRHADGVYRSTCTTHGPHFQEAL